MATSEYNPTRFVIPNSGSPFFASTKFLPPTHNRKRNQCFFKRGEWKEEVGLNRERKEEKRTQEKRCSDKVRKTGPKKCSFKN
jgi:hypothetical protein